MAKTVVTRPYEFLVRWRDGAISGAHVGFEDAIVEDGSVLSVHPQNVQPVAVGAAQGFPLADILQQIQVDALTDREDAINQANLAIAEKKIAEQTCAAHEKTIASLQAQIATLTKELENARTPEAPAQ